MRIYNTMTRRKEEVVADGENKISVYACGPTVYNLIHIGNARQICVFDVLRRYLKYRGYDVFFVQNFTDIDDKIIKKASETAQSPSEVAENAIKDYFLDARALGVTDADIHPKVTQCIGIIIELIQTLIDKGFAYLSAGDVYFRTKKFKEYGKLSQMPLEELEQGASNRVGENALKEAPIDFALWKSVDSENAQEFSWESPFGRGRPGWHIECSAMARHYIGDTINIHGGGADLIFPHHENEIAQSEAATGSQFAKIWMHNGMLNVDNQKMSKSLGNFLLVRNVAALYGYTAVRFMLLSAHYRSQLNYSQQVMESAVNSVARLKNCHELLKRTATCNPAGEIRPEVKQAVKRKEQFISAMDDDLNTADGITAIFELTREINTLINNGVNKTEVEFLGGMFSELCGVIGIEFVDEADDIPKEVWELVELRKTARKEKNFAHADEIRQKLLEMGYAVEETRQGTNVKLI
ncbi:MAG: cysteine--tRNA ligase [Oscillospiraceae bacterium]|nr:cysteine--tRNA ligase [Oscillospiraceae bacterium]